MSQRPISAAATAGLLGAVLLFIIQLVMQSSGIGGPPTGVAMANKLLNVQGESALVLGAVLFALAGAVWGILYATLVAKISPLTGLLFSIAPTLVALSIILPILGKPFFAGGDAKGILTPLVLNGIWGLFVGTVTPLLHTRRSG